VEGAGEQEGAEHPLQDRFVEVDPRHELEEAPDRREAEAPECHQRPREHEGDHHQTDGRGQADPAMVRPGEQGGHRGEESDEFEFGHWCGRV
jgi:hypothetical protein